MQWTSRGVHLLVQLRTRVLDGTLDSDFKRWREGTATFTERGENGRMTPPAFSCSPVQVAETIGPPESSNEDDGYLREFRSVDFPIVSYEDNFGL